MCVLVLLMLVSCMLSTASFVLFSHSQSRHQMKAALLFICTVYHSVQIVHHRMTLGCLCCLQYCLYCSSQNDSRVSVLSTVLFILFITMTVGCLYCLQYCLYCSSQNDSRE